MDRADVPCFNQSGLSVGGRRPIPGVQERVHAVRRGRLYYGWVVVATVSLTELISWGAVYYAFTVFLRPMQESLGWPVPTLTGAFSLAVAVSGVTGLGLGRWIDRHGPRLVMTVGSVVAGGLLWVWSDVRTLWVFYLVWVGLGAAMAGILYDPAFALTAVWFRRHRSLALSVVTLVAGWASIVFVPGTAWLVLHVGWRRPSRFWR